MVRARVEIGPDGRFVIPAELRRALGVGEGDTVLVRMDGDELRVSTPQAAIAHHRAPGRSQAARLRRWGPSRAPAQHAVERSVEMPTDEGPPDAAGPTLSEVVDKLDMVSDEVTIYYDRVTNAFIERIDPAIVGEDLAADEPTEEELLEDDRYVPLPDAFDIHEWRILRDFCVSRPEGALRDQLLEAVHGRGAFRWTKSIIWDHGLRDDWFAYRDEALAAVARSWAEEYDIVLADEPAS